MKRWISLISFICIISCKPKPNKILGDWVVNSNFYNANYQIQQNGKELQGLVLYYNDGTTIYKHDGSQQHYVFEGLKKKGERYVDGVSGATQKSNASEVKSKIEIKEKHLDTLEVTTYIMNRPIVEIWTRKK